jgi:hypothetical protein
MLLIHTNVKIYLTTTKQKKKYEIYNLHIKALNSDINFNEIIRVFQTFKNCVLMKNNF